MIEGRFAPRIFIGGERGVTLRLCVIYVSFEKLCYGKHAVSLTAT
jgi:hypothetical protein